MSHTKKTAIVTGASSGLGLATAEAFLADDYNVVMNGSNPDRLATAYESLGRPDAAITVAGDVGQASDRRALVEAALARFARIDVLVNNAGLFSPRPFLDVDEDYLDAFLTTNLKGTFFLSQAVIPHMREIGGGSIVNIGTVLVDHALGGRAVSDAHMHLDSPVPIRERPVRDPVGDQHSVRHDDLGSIQRTDHAGTDPDALHVPPDVR